MSKLVRVSDEAYSKLDQISKKIGSSKQDVIDTALNNLERETILKQANDAYSELKKNRKEWLEYQEELSLWDVTLEDGLKDE
jgi:predicted transcriptional regulator